MSQKPISPERLSRAKWAYTTRLVDRQRVTSLLTGENILPRAGDLVLARVDRLGQHKRLELVTSRRASLFEEDEIVVVFGNRYAPDQFEGIVPDRLERCHLVAAGGVAARMLNLHDRMKMATRITPLGLLGDSNGSRLNLNQFRLPPQAIPEQRPLFLAVAGTSMNAGKTTACANLVKGLVRTRFRVGAAKITGTGAGVDYRSLVDAGADPTLDFIDAGYVSTYLTSNDQLRDMILTLGGALANSSLDAVVIEVADGLLQRETSQIFMMEEFTSLLDGVIFAANDALGAQSGVAWLTQRGLPVLGVTGVLTSSPLAIREAELATGLPVYRTSDLARSVVASMMIACLKHRRKVESGLDEEGVYLPGGEGLHSSVVG